jgi:hypothetical protein
LERITAALSPLLFEALLCAGRPMVKTSGSQPGPVSKSGLIAVSCPGGMARQFRVQIASSETPSHWQLAGTFRDDNAARQCADQLRQTGALARVLECRALPTAA